MEGGVKYDSKVGKTFYLRPLQIVTSANNFQCYVFEFYDTSCDNYSFLADVECIEWICFGVFLHVLGIVQG